MSKSKQQHFLPRASKSVRLTEQAEKDLAELLAYYTDILPTIKESDVINKAISNLLITVHKAEQEVKALKLQ